MTFEFRGQSLFLDFPAELFSRFGFVSGVENENQQINRGYNFSLLLMTRGLEGAVNFAQHQNRPRPMKNILWEEEEVEVLPQSK